MTGAFQGAGAGLMALSQWLSAKSEAENAERIRLEEEKRRQKEFGQRYQLDLDQFGFTKQEAKRRAQSAEAAELRERGAGAYTATPPGTTLSDFARAFAEREGMPLVQTPGTPAQASTATIAGTAFPSILPGGAPTASRPQTPTEAYNATNQRVVEQRMKADARSEQERSAALTRLAAGKATPQDYVILNTSQRALEDPALERVHEMRLAAMRDAPKTTPPGTMTPNERTAYDNEYKRSIVAQVGSFAALEDLPLEQRQQVAATAARHAMRYVEEKVRGQAPQAAPTGRLDTLSALVSELRKAREEAAKRGGGS